jgi:hypothetical protein
MKGAYIKENQARVYCGYLFREKLFTDVGYFDSLSR